MKTKLVAIVLPVVLMVSGCLKDESEEQRAEEQKMLEEYITELEQQGINVNETEQGLYYVVKDSGEGESPRLLEDLIEINFTGRLMDGRIIQTTSSDTAKKYGFYDSTNFYGAYRYQFGNGFPSGFNIGLSLMQEKASYKLIIPSDLGFGGISFSGIPPYSTLIYDVTLEEVITKPVQFEKNRLLDYLEENNIPVEDSTETGLYIITLEEGTGDSIQSNDIVSVQYTLKNLKDQVIGRSNPGNPFKFGINDQNIIPGFRNAVSMMTLNQKAKVIIPWYEAYGELGYGSIPPYTTLVYELKVVKLE